MIYSPTISAGVSFDEEHFDCFFGLFSNNAGKVDNLRQMINRVRNFSTNEFYYCLEKKGGKAGPTTEEDLERFICSNRFYDKPEFIFSREEYDGTREYPNKDFSYHLWFKNQLETNKDKLCFMYNFISKQYQNGITDLNIMKGEEDEKPAVNDKEVNLEKRTIKAQSYDDIANARVINDQEKNAIEENIKKNIHVNDSDISALKQYNLRKTYDLNDVEYPTLTPVFVKTYNQN